MKASLAIVAHAPLVAVIVVNLRKPRQAKILLPTCCEGVMSRGVTTHGLLDYFIGRKIDGMRRS